MPPVIVTAPAKLTVTLRVTGVRSDGYHLLDAEMVSVDLYDVLEITAFGAADGDVASAVEVVDEVVGGLGLTAMVGGADNLVDRALAAVEQRAGVRLRKRIPVGAGLGGGSSDAAAVLRWAGRRDLLFAASLGADVPFCVVGGRARVGGIGEMVDALPFEERMYLLVLPPLVVDTAAVYRAWDAGCRPLNGMETSNDLEPAALDVAPDLAHWRDALSVASGRVARLAGSGATWFVEADEELARRVRAGELGDTLTVHGAHAPLHLVSCVGPHPR